MYYAADAVFCINAVNSKCFNDDSVIQDANIRALGFGEISLVVTCYHLSQYNYSLDQLSSPDKNMCVSVVQLAIRL
jgi:hypothetical protein